MFRYVKLFCEIILFVIITSCARKNDYEKTNAYKRWGITRPLTDSIAEKELSLAYDLLYSQKFVDAKNAYEKIVVRFPMSAEVHLGLSMSYRYLNKLSEAVFECEQAMVLDSSAIGVLLNYADLLSPFRGAKFKENLSDSIRYILAENYYKKALKIKHPLSNYAHIGLWNVYTFGFGQLLSARQQMMELGKKKYFPDNLVDFAYNMLITAEPDAILFTNGDNDTYPLLCLQESENIRRDVSIVNINLLNIPRIARLMRDSLKVPISFNDSMLGNMRPLKDKRGFWVYPADNLIANIVENARKLKKPVYFAATVDRNRVPYYAQFFITEGLLMKMADAKVKDSINIDKLKENLDKNYRLKNIGKKDIWVSNLSPITRNYIHLAANYIVVAEQLAQCYEKQNNKKDALVYYQWISKFIEQVDLPDWSEPIKDKIQELAD